MSQNKNAISNYKWVSIILYMILISISFSCAKKQSSSKTAVRKTQAQSMNPMVQAQAEQQATAQGLMYKIHALNTPVLNENETGFNVIAELLTPNNQYLPVTTTHEAGRVDSEGLFNDTARGVQVNVSARCQGGECEKYLMMVTVIKNNTAVFQSAALSFKNDCHFYTVSTAQGVSGFFRNLDELESRTQNYSAKNDCPVSE